MSYFRWSVKAELQSGTSWPGGYGCDHIANALACADILAKNGFVARVVRVATGAVVYVGQA